MPSITVDILVQTTAGVLAALIVIGVQAVFLRRPGGRRAQTSGPLHKAEVVRAVNENGNQALVSGSHACVQQQFQSNTTSVTQHYHSPRESTRGSESEWVYIVLLFLAAVVAAGLFVLGWPVIRAAVFGSASANMLISVVTVARSVRLHGELRGREWVSLIAVAATAAISVATWEGITTIERRGYSLNGLTAALPPFTGSGAMDWLEYLLQDVVATSFGFSHLGSVLFVELLILAAVANSGMLLVSGQDILQWRARLRVAGGDTVTARMRRRAEAYDERVIWFVLSLIILAGVAIVSASGVGFDWMEAARMAGIGA